MPTDADETLVKDALYPDDLEGQTLEIDGERLNGTVAFYHADGDAESLPDGCRKGWWLPVDSAEHGETWAASPKSLREAVAGLEPGDIFEVTRCRKRGDEQTSPWDVEVAVLTDA